MTKCKSDICENKVIGKRIYCSSSCRTRTTNLLYRDYSKTAKKLSDRVRKNYEVKQCKECGKNIEYENRENIFCNHTCAATYNNEHREYKKVIFSEEGLANIRTAAAKRRGTGKAEKGRWNPRNCAVCGSEFQKWTKYCSVKCYKQSRRKNIGTIGDYRTQCRFRFGLSDYPNKFDFDLVRQYGWYSPSNKKNNLTGVSRDHMLSVADGLKLGVAPELISHPANCRLMIHSENIAKNHRSCITLEQLQERIAYW